MRKKLTANEPFPFVLFIEPTNVCNFRCPFCPVGSESDYQAQAPPTFMSPLTWYNTLESIIKWDNFNLQVARFYHTGEPFLHKDLCNMVTDLKGVSPRTRAIVYTNGSKLNWKLCDNILKSELDTLRLSVYGTSDEEYKKVGKNINLLALRNSMLYLKLHRVGSVPILEAELVNARNQVEFREQWSSIVDTCLVKDMHNWGGSLTQIGAPAQKKVCPYPFFELAVKASGLVSVCSVDWNNQLIVGDINSDTLEDIWHGKLLAELRDIHMRGQKHILESCANCNLFETGTPENVDHLLMENK